MKNQVLKRCNRKLLPLMIATALGVSACGGDQAGDTNGGFAGAGGSSAGALGIIGGAALLAAIVASDSDSSDGGSMTNPDGTVTNPDGTVTNPDGTVTNPDGTVTNPDGTVTNPDGTVTNPDGTVTNPDGTVTNPDGSVTNPDGTATNPDGSTTAPDGTVRQPDGTLTTPDGTVIDPGGTRTAPDGTVTLPADVDGGLLTASGRIQASLLASEAVPASFSSNSAVADLQFTAASGLASGAIDLTGINATSVDIMIGPPGSNGFVGIALEQDGNTWRIPSTLSAAQTGIVMQNLLSGNLYIAARSADYPEGELRRQILPANVSQYTSSTTGTRGGTAEGYLMLNNDTGDYAITWNTLGGPALMTNSSHVNDGVVSGATENDYAILTVRESNQERFFLYGNYNDAADPLYPDLPTRLANGQVWLDSHAASDGSRVFFGQLLP